MNLLRVRLLIVVVHLFNNFLQLLFNRNQFNQPYPGLTSDKLLRSFWSGSATQIFIFKPENMFLMSKHFKLSIIYRSKNPDFLFLSLRHQWGRLTSKTSRTSLYFSVSIFMFCQRILLRDEVFFFSRYLQPISKSSALISVTDESQQSMATNQIIIDNLFSNSRRERSQGNES